MMLGIEGEGAVWDEFLEEGLGVVVGVGVFVVGRARLARGMLVWFVRTL